MVKKIFAVFAMFALMCLSGDAVFAGWTVTSLNPTGATNSGARAVNGSQQAGSVEINNGAIHAGIWSGTAGSWLDINPDYAMNSIVCGSSDNQQAGYIYFDNKIHAGMWSGTAESWVDLNPSETAYSNAYGISGNQQAGYALGHAALWIGTPESWVDLNPTGSFFSIANGVSNGQQVGSASFFPDTEHAGLWTGTAESWVDLNPDGASSSAANGNSESQQTGYARIKGEDHAALWSGTAESFIDLNPTGAMGSEARSTSDGKQAGVVWFGSPNEYGDIEPTIIHAALWSGTAESWLDLHYLLPTNQYLNSSASNIYVSADEIWVVGSATNTSYHNEAILWHYTANSAIVPEPSSIIVLAVGIISLLEIKRRKA